MAKKRAVAGERARRDILRYSKEGAHQGTVKRHYLRWRAEQKLPLPFRCDNPQCVFHTSPLIWNGKPLEPILDHKFGNRTDNSAEALWLLCPNCDSQQADTRGGANKGRVERLDGGFSRIGKDGKRGLTIVLETSTLPKLTPEEIERVEKRISKEKGDS